MESPNLIPRASSLKKKGGKKPWERGCDITVFLFQDNICRTPERDELDHLALLGNRDRLVLLGNKDRLALRGNKDVLVFLGNRDLLVLLGNRDLLVLLGNGDQLDQKDQKVSRTNDIEIKGENEAFITPV